MQHIGNYLQNHATFLFLGLPSKCLWMFSKYLKMPIELIDDDTCMTGTVHLMY